MTSDQKQKIKKRYKISHEDYLAMLEKQGHRCAICENVENVQKGKQRMFVVDHCHLSGAVRGLLCISCNTRLGGLENKDWFERATAYLNPAQ